MSRDSLLIPSRHCMAKKEGSRRRGIWQGWAVGLLAFATFAYARPSDALYGFTIWPAWVWLAVGLGLAALSRKGRRWLGLAWAVFGVLFVEEFRSFPRGLFP